MRCWFGVHVATNTAQKTTLKSNPQGYTETIKTYLEFQFLILIKQEKKADLIGNVLLSLFGSSYVFCVCGTRMWQNELGWGGGF